MLKELVDNLLPEVKNRIPYLGGLRGNDIVTVNIEVPQSKGRVILTTLGEWIIWFKPLSRFNNTRYTAYIARTPSEAPLGGDREFEPRSTFLPPYVTLSQSANTRNLMTWVRRTPSYYLEKVLDPSSFAHLMDVRAGGFITSATPPSRRALDSHLMGGRLSSDNWVYMPIDSYIVLNKKELLLTTVPPLYERTIFVIIPHGRFKIPLGAVMKGKFRLPKEEPPADIAEASVQSASMLEELLAQLTVGAGV